jgi:DNA-binding transcriptional LysR family regulator
VADAGSTLAAGRALRVSQTTVARRITALEDALDLVLFERRQAGYRLTPAGEALLTHARAAEEPMRRLSAEAAQFGRAAGGVVRATMSPIFAFTFMAPIIRDLRLAHPELRIDLDTSETMRDLVGGEADIALRVSKGPVGAGLMCRRLTDNPWTVYCSRGYAEQHGLPRRIADLAGAPLIGGGEPEVWQHYREWLVENHLEGQVVMQHTGSAGLLAAVRAGMGLAVLPCLVADGDPIWYGACHRSAGRSDCGWSFRNASATSRASGRWSTSSRREFRATAVRSSGDRVVDPRAGMRAGA